MNYEEQVDAVKKTTENDPKMQKIMLEILEVERLFPDESGLMNEGIRLGALNAIIKKSVTDGTFDKMKATADKCKKQWDENNENV